MCIVNYNHHAMCYFCNRYIGSNISGRLCEGKVEGTLHIDNFKSESPDITGQFRFEDMDLAKLVEDFNRPGKITTGKATLDYYFDANNLDMEALSGHGFIAIASPYGFSGSPYLPKPLCSIDE